MRKIILILIVTSLVLSVTSCNSCAVIRKDGPYKGIVIDADTGEPIEGVVVLGVWNREIITPGGATHKFYDAKETVTNKHGEFVIRGLGVKVFCNITPMDVLIFKAGYTAWGYMTWKELKKTVETEDDMVIIRLKKMTMEERKKQGMPSRPNIPEENMKLMTEEINRERLKQGFRPFVIEE
jgi:hypothetical protein